MRVVSGQANTAGRGLPSGVEAHILGGSPPHLVEMRHSSLSRAFCLMFPGRMAGWGEKPRRQKRHLPTVRLGRLQPAGSHLQDLQGATDGRPAAVLFDRLRHARWQPAQGPGRSHSSRPPPLRPVRLQLSEVSVPRRD